MLKFSIYLNRRVFVMQDNESRLYYFVASGCRVVFVPFCLMSCLCVCSVLSRFITSLGKEEAGRLTSHLVKCSGYGCYYLCALPLFIGGRLSQAQDPFFPITISFLFSLQRYTI